MTLRQHFEEDMSKLNKDILKMGMLVERAMTKAISSFINKDFVLAEQVIEEDQKINEMENLLCDQCALLVAREQPVASDLRHILGAIKIITQLERVGDHAVHIAEKGKKIGQEKLIKSSIENFPKMEELGRVMLIDSLNAFVERNAKLALEVAQRDEEIDIIHDKVTRKVLKKIHENNAKIDQGVELLFIARYLERFGDHVKNICEWVCYAQQGEHIDL